ncbi:MAG: GTPase HflX [Saprospiraceae bacterium]|nr:GTPase HflX [Saprospiraceae bacterium]MCF8251246.1 GTPase HflX [Saprospiraceae bacterium]MCF8282987.1 GTPase HflX [Bacteroidales bacterium]MCF8313130.1 GTPase HflX [Saprospiraceae bacterium]MCF8441608.1 GTPase HflX [Saprospiraceae bacterium]
MNKEWNLNTNQAKGLKEETEYAVLVGVIYGMQTEEQVEEYLNELEFLALTAGAQSIRRYVQRLPNPHPRTFIGTGKLDEIKKYVDLHEEVNMVIFDDDLSGKQVSALEAELKVKIVDRSSLILDIFARRAQTAQAKTQVELAQLQYLLPRLRGLWTHLERQRGGIGMRGPGEKEIETDRRIVRDKIAILKKQLEKIDKQATTQRKTRGQLIRVSLVGYTNVGKSTLMNVLSKSEVFAENKLFATLDTTVRKVVLESVPFLLSDTVGFIRKLPHHLVESFKSTLDEVRESDILLHVVDVGHAHYEDHIASVNETLSELGARDKPTLMVFNKIDIYRDKNFDALLDGEIKKEIEGELLSNLKNQYEHDCIFISAANKEGIEQLREMLVTMVKREYQIRYPHEVRNW